MQRSSMPVAAFLASILVVAPFLMQRTLFRRQNLPSFMVALWLLFANIICGVDTLVWAQDATIHIPIWCDITTKYLIGVSYAVPACLFTMSSRLKTAASRNTLGKHRSVGELREAFIMDLALCVGMPLAAMALHTVVQGHRFDIIESIGCQPEIPAVSAGTIFFWLPAIILSILSLFHCGSSWRTIIGPERTWLGMYIDNFDPPMSIQLFFSQLMLILCVASLWIAFLVMTIYESLKLEPTGSSTLPFDLSRIDTYTVGSFTKTSWRNRLFCWWAIPVAALAFSFWFLIFPLAEKVERIVHHAHGRLARGTTGKNSIIALKDLKVGDGLVVRKYSTVEITVEEYDSSSYNEAIQPYSTSPVKEGYEPRWSCPWEGVRPMTEPKGKSRPHVSRRSQDGDHDHDFVIMELPINHADLVNPHTAETDLQGQRLSSASPV